MKNLFNIKVILVTLLFSTNVFATVSRTDDFFADIQATLRKYTDLRTEALSYQLTFGGPFKVTKIQLSGPSHSCYKNFEIELEDVTSGVLSTLKSGYNKCID